jgi:hypothetical protein
MRIREQNGKTISGVRNPKSKLTVIQVNEIRRRALAGEPLKMLSEEFQVSAPTISQIKNGNLWKSVTSVKV